MHAVNICRCVVILIAIASAAPKKGITIHIAGRAQVIVGRPSDGTTQKVHEDTCNREEFQCSNGKSIRKSYRCDGDVDCTDGTDEINCPDDSEMIKFLGSTMNDDHFKVLLTDFTSQSLLVGGRNVIYNLSLYDLTEQNRIEWPPESQQMSLCYIKGGSDEDCQNYVRILTEKRYGEYLICGTNAYNPMCRDYTLTDGVLELKREFAGRGLCSFDPSHNSTSVYVDDQLYVGTIADFSGLEPIIYRESLRTEQYDESSLNAPNFVKSFALGDYVYFFFREIAVESMNCGKAVYSRVARVCRHDKGGPHKFKHRWTSYLKSRLNCSIPGDFPFYFNEIQAATGPVEGRYGDYATTLIYGVFTTPENFIQGSAVCAFTFQDIMDTFEGPFKGQDSVNANWLPIHQAKVPEPRPGLCVKDSSTLPDVTLNFIKSHSLMDEAVPVFFDQPILISTSIQYSGRFTSIEVDPQVTTPDGKNYDVLFVGTDDGNVLKAVNTQSHDSHQQVEPFIIEKLKVFEHGTAIISLKIIRPTNKAPRLIVTSRTQIHSIPLWRCNTDKITTCGDCLNLRDPYCVWDKSTHKCRATMDGREILQENEMIQSVASGTHAECKGEVLKKTDQETMQGSHISELHGNNGAGDSENSSSGATVSNTPSITYMPIDYHKNEIRKFLLQNSNAYLKWSPDSHKVSIGSHTGDDSNCEVCWRIHHYRSGEHSNDGSLVILETLQGVNYIYVPTSTSLRPSVINGSTNSELISLSSSDARVFTLKHFPYTSLYRLQHLQTGKYISTGRNGEVVLTGNLEDSAKFLLFTV